MTAAAEARLDPARAPWLTDPECRALVQALGVENARFVGGAVRDALLGLPAPADLDIATRLPPEEVMRRLTAQGFKVIPTGLSHGTVTAVGASGRHYEITTLRIDVETDGRHAKVSFTDDWKADAARRDFTINALFCDLEGRIHDHFGGIADLKAGRVRFIGDARERIREDALRILRFFRFHAWYGRGRPDPEGLAACAALADMLAILSIERVRDELLKLLAAPDPCDALRAMAETGVLGRVLPAVRAGAVEEMPRLIACERMFAAILPEEDVWRPLRRLAFLHERDAEGWEQEGRRLKFSRRQIAALGALAIPLSGHDERALKAEIYHRGRVATVNRAVIEAVGRDKEEARALACRLAALADWRPPRFPLSGRDLIAAGFRPGPALGRLLDRLEAEWIAADFAPDREALLARARALTMAGGGRGEDRRPD